MACRRKKSCKGGRVTRNAFLNFLREYRKKHCGWPVTKVAKEGARVWCKMNPCERKKYIDQARCAPRSKRRRKRKSRSRSRCGKKRKRKRSRSGCGKKRRRRSRGCKRRRSIC